MNLVGLMLGGAFWAGMGWDFARHIGCRSSGMLLEGDRLQEKT